MSDNQLIKVTVKNNQQLVSARDLHKGLGLAGRFSRWFKNNSEFFEENTDFYKCTSSTVVNNGAVRILDDYLLTISMAKQLAMMARTERSKLYKQNGVNIGSVRLFRWLRKHGYLIKRDVSDYNMPTQKSMERKLFVVKETVITHSDGHTTISKTPKVTGKGQIYFVNKFLKSSNPDTEQFRKKD